MDNGFDWIVNRIKDLDPIVNSNMPNNTSKITQLIKEYLTLTSTYPEFNKQEKEMAEKLPSALNEPYQKAFNLSNVKYWAVSKKLQDEDYCTDTVYRGIPIIITYDNDGLFKSLAYKSETSNKWYFGKNNWVDLKFPKKVSLIGKGDVYIKAILTIDPVGLEDLRYRPHHGNLNKYIHDLINYRLSGRYKNTILKYLKIIPHDIYVKNRNEVFKFRSSFRKFFKDNKFTSPSSKIFSYDMLGKLEFYFRAMFEHVAEVNTLKLKGCCLETGYLTDGLLIHTDRLDHPKSSEPLFYALPNDSTLAEIDAIVWHMSYGNTLLPYAVLKDSTVIGTETVDKVCLMNASQIELLNIGKGSTVEIGLLTNKAPFIKSVLISQSVLSEQRAPTQCPYCAETIKRKGNFLLCPNYKCSKFTENRIRDFLSRLSIRGSFNVAEFLKEIPISSSPKILTLIESNIGKYDITPKYLKSFLRYKEVIQDKNHSDIVSIHLSALGYEYRPFVNHSLLHRAPPKKIYQLAYDQIATKRLDTVCNNIRDHMRYELEDLKTYLISEYKIRL